MAGERTIRRRYKQELDKVGGTQQMWGQRQLQELQQAMQSIQGGYGRAMGEVGSMFTGERRRVRERETQQNAADNQSLTQRGLNATTLLEGAQRGRARDASVGFQDIAARQAGMMGNLQVGQGGAMANQQNMIAQLFGLRSAQDERTGMQRFGLQGMTEQETDWGGMIGSTLGGIGGSFIPGMGGAMGAGLGGMIGGGIGGKTTNAGYGGFGQLFGQGMGGGQFDLKQLMGMFGGGGGGGYSDATWMSPGMGG